MKKVSLCNQKTLMTAFDYNASDVRYMFELDRQNKDDQVESGVFGISKGARFDHKNHHWLLFDDYMALSFSYMSFVIKQDLELYDGFTPNHTFDMEAYNYLFNQRTSFMDSTFIRNDTDELPYVLENLERLDLANLGILNYRRKSLAITEEEEDKSSK